MRTARNGASSISTPRRTRLLTPIVGLIAVLLLVPVWSDLIFPEFLKVPADLDNTTWLDGELGVLNETTLRHDEHAIKIRNEINAYKHSDDPRKMYLRVNNTLLDPATMEPLPDLYQPYEVRFAIDRANGKYIPEDSETKVGGNYALPIGRAEKKTYQWWDYVVQRPVENRFIEETNHHGIDVWVFETSTHDYPVTATQFGYEEVELNGEPIDLVYDREDIYYIEPTSSVPVDQRVEYSISACVPDLDYLPMGFTQNLSWEGVFAIVNESEVTALTNINFQNLFTGPLLEPEDYLDYYNITLATVAKNTETVNDDTIALIDIVSAFTNDDTGEPLPEMYQPEPLEYGILRYTNEHVEGYGDRDRRGHFMFPLGRLEKRTYDFWDDDLNTTVETVFKGIEQHAGYTTYCFESSVENVPLDPETLPIPFSLPPRTEIVYTGTRVYWAEVASAVILDTFADVRIDFRSQLYNWSKPVMYLTMNSTGRSINETVELARLWGLAAPYSNGKLPAFHLAYWYTDGSREYIISQAELARNAIVFGQLWVPAIFYSLAGVFTVIAIVRVVRKRRQRQAVTVTPMNVP